jgi:hypothetical protein
MYLTIKEERYCLDYTEKNQYQKFETYYSQKRNCAATSPNLHIHVSVSDLYIPTIDLPILLQEKCGPILENI